MKTDYTQAPATLLIASHCAACGRPLLDAVSVRTGMGPDCADKYNCAEIRGTKEQTRANAVIYAIAAEQKIADWNRIRGFLAELSALGFGVVAERIKNRLEPSPVIFLTSDKLDNGAPALRVLAPYHAEATQDWRNIRGREFREETITETIVNKKTNKAECVSTKLKFNRVPATKEARLAVLALLSRHYPGMIASGCKGVFEIPAEAPPAE